MAPSSRKRKSSSSNSSTITSYGKKKQRRRTGESDGGDNDNHDKSNRARRAGGGRSGLLKPPTRVEEVVFDFAQREDYLTGFHKRKQERIKAARERAIEREKEEKKQERRHVSCGFAIAIVIVGGSKSTGGSGHSNALVAVVPLRKLHHASILI